MADQQNSQQVARILYKEIVAGDKRKVQATSNDSDSGGGARDFRFGSYPRLLPVIKKMFPTIVSVERKRASVITAVDVFKGAFYWRTSTGTVEIKESFFEPPTDARPSEGRITRVSDYGCFDVSRIPAGGVGNRILLLLVQLYDDTVWPYFAEEQSLRTPGLWDPVVARELLQCLDAARPEGRAVIGFRDFITAHGYCDGK